MINLRTLKNQGLTVNTPLTDSHKATLLKQAVSLPKYTKLLIESILYGGKVTPSDLLKPVDGMQLFTITKRIL